MTLVQIANLYVEQKIANPGASAFRVGPLPFAVTDFALREFTGFLGGMDFGVRTQWPMPRTIGAAITVRCHAGDNIMYHKAVSLSQPAGRT